MFSSWSHTFLGSVSEVVLVCVRGQSGFSGGWQIKASRVGPIRTSSRTDGWTSAAFRLWTSLWTVAFLPSRRLHWTRPARTAAWILREWSDRQRNTASADRPRSIRTDSHSAPSRDASRDSSWSEGTFWRTESGRWQTSAERATVQIIIWLRDDPNFFRLFLRTFSGSIKISFWFGSQIYDFFQKSWWR